MRGNGRGYTLVEMMVVLAIIGILMASTVPLGSFWIERAKLAKVRGELSHGIGLTVGAAIRNEHALDNINPAASLCLSDTNQLSVLEASASELPNCANATGTTVWTSSVGADVVITVGGSDFSCACFNSLGLATTDSCSGCSTANVLDITLGEREEILRVY